MSHFSSSTSTMPSAYTPHNHQQCVVSALQQASDICKKQGTRLTPIRKRVLELVWQSHRALGAYDLMSELVKDGHKSAPPTVYRALEFLQKNGLVHRIASLNAFIGCTHPAEQHSGCFLICQHCQAVQEINGQAIQQSITSESKQSGFSVTTSVVEISGLCPNCQNQVNETQKQELP